MPNKAYKIEKLNDFITKIPLDALPRFLEEFAEKVTIMASIVQSTPEPLIELNHMTWIDDGEREFFAYIDGEEIKNEN